MTSSTIRSPSPSSRHRRYCFRAFAMIAAAMLMCVGAFTAGRSNAHLGGANSNPLVPSFRRLEPDVNTLDCVHHGGATQDRGGQIPSCVSAHHISSSSSSSSIGWIGYLKRCWDDAVHFSCRLLFAGHEQAPPDCREKSPSPACPAEPRSDSALDLASSTRGGGGQRGWWYPGRRARRRKNLERAAERAATKRSAAAAGGASGLPSGLANQGNTCYLNSLLQTLYHAPGLREAVLDATVSSDDGNGDGDGDAATVSALATVFRQLDQGGRTASTLPLTRAMGVDPRVQQDAQEFGRFLFMALEGEGGQKSASSAGKPKSRGGGDGSGDVGDGDGDGDKQGGLSDTVKDLFAGRLMNYIECVDVPFSKEREEVFYDLPLDIKGSGTLQKSLDRFVEAELLTGENRWRAGEHGLQDARKGMRFLQLPAVLQFHLKRFEYDPFRDDLAKIHDRFEFPTELDMSPWLHTKENEKEENHHHHHQSQAGDDTASSTSDDGNPGAYKLSAVVMHVGGPAAGHYYAYVRYTKPASVPPSPSPAPGSPDALKAKVGRSRAGKGIPPKQQQRQQQQQQPTATSTPTPMWVKLDDHRVTKVSEAEVLRDAFGWGGGVYTGPGAELQGFFGQQGSRGGGTASAYMLQYVRDQDQEVQAAAEEERRIEEARECAQP